MMKRLWKFLDDFEDTALAPYLGFAVLALITYALLLVPEAGLGGAQ